MLHPELYHRKPRIEEFHIEGEPMQGYGEAELGWKIPVNCFENQYGNRVDILGRECSILCNNGSHQMTLGLPCPQCGWEY